MASTATLTVGFFFFKGKCLILRICTFSRFTASNAAETSASVCDSFDYSAPVAGRPSVISVRVFAMVAADLGRNGSYQERRGDGNSRVKLNQRKSLAVAGAGARERAGIQELGLRLRKL